MEPTQQGATVHELLTEKLTPNVDDESTQTTTDEDVSTTQESEVEDEPGSQEPESQEAENDTSDEGLSLADVASVLGLDEDSLDVNDEGELLIKSKIDGNESSSKFKDIHTTYQKSGHIDNLNREVAEQKKTLQTTADEQEASFKQRLQIAEDVINLGVEQLTSEFKSVNWDELEIEDPAEYAAKSIKFQNRKNELGEQLSNLQAERQKLVDADNRKAADNLITAFPTWQDTAVAQKEFTEVTNYLTKQSFTLNEARNISDPRAITIARKAMLYDKLQSDKPTITKKVKKISKVVKPGSPTTKESLDSDSKKKLLSNIKKSKGKGGSVADYLLKTGMIK